MLRAFNDATFEYLRLSCCQDGSQGRAGVPLPAVFPGDSKELSSPRGWISYQEHCGSAEKSDSAEGMMSVITKWECIPLPSQLDLGSEVTEEGRAISFHA